MRNIFVFHQKCARTTLNKVLNNSGLNELNIHRRSLQKILLSEKPEEKSTALQIS